jgi:hypothetical protein
MATSHVMLHIGSEFASILPRAGDLELPGVPEGGRTTAAGTSMGVVCCTGRPVSDAVAL